MAKISVLKPPTNSIKPVLMLLTSHRLDCFMLCVKCLERFTDLSRLKRIYVLANSVTEEHAAVIERFRNRHSNVSVLDCRPRGLIPAVNIAQNTLLARHGHDVIIKIEEDLFVTPNWLEHLLHAYQLHRHRTDVPVLSPLTPVSATGRHSLIPFLNAAYPSERSMFAGPPVEDNWVYHRWIWDKVLTDNLVESFLEQGPQPYDYLNFLNVNCIIYDQRLIQKVLPLPVRRYPNTASTENIAFNKALWENNLKLGIINTSIVHHYSHARCEEYLRTHIPLDSVWRFLSGINVDTPPKRVPQLPPSTALRLRRAVR
ncbi:glycosyltransferase [Desulfovibrio inopinatus]|uniref:glycosyltransferase n=1 Tax=Desulfovibrio inopinatus TaxID=102109 RepID=UPI00041FDBF2|nr:glycosyltransferase [Desulfovibrio inopinatus]